MLLLILLFRLPIRDVIIYTCNLDKKHVWYFQRVSKMIYEKTICSVQKRQMVHKVMAFKHIKVSNKRTKSSVFHDTGRIMESNCNNRDTGQNVKKKSWYG